MEQQKLTVEQEIELLKEEVYRLNQVVKLLEDSIRRHKHVNEEVLIKF